MGLRANVCNRSIDSDMMAWALIQYWLGLWLGAVVQQAIACANLELTV